MAFTEPLVIELEGRIESPGESVRVEGVLDVASYAVGEKEFTLDNGIAYDVMLTNAGDGILATGIVRAQATGTCDRCLDPAHIDIAGEIEEYFLFQAPDDPEEYEDGFELVGENRSVDLSGPISDAVIMDTPFVVLCRPDCAGLCPTCGCNLNREQCDCTTRAEEEWVASDENPFAALKNLKLDE